MEFGCIMCCYVVTHQCYIFWVYQVLLLCSYPLNVAVKKKNVKVEAWL